MKSELFGSQIILPGTFERLEELNAEARALPKQGNEEILKEAFAKAKASGSIDERVKYAQLARKLRGE